MVWIVLGGALLLTVGVLAVLAGGKRGFPWVQFFVKGKESGFSLKEVNLLRKVAQQNKLKNPSSLFWSERALDRCIRGTITRFRASGTEGSKDNIDFLQELFGFRKRVEFNLPKYRLGITSSRNISAGQVMKITFAGGGAYVTTVVENIRRYLAVTYPKGKALPPGFSWKGQNIRIYFWRPEDAGYYFESKVVGDFLDRKFPILHIAHSDSLVRAQKRGSVRREVTRPVTLLPLTNIRNANEKWEETGGYRGRTIDISEDGIAVMVGGKAKAGMPIKLQLELAGHRVVMCGTVRGVSYKQKNNVSILHIQSVPLSAQMKNTVLTYVYGIFEEENQDKKTKKKSV
ncbi:flagellar brake protein [Spirochaeta dissipatitropha]